MLQDTHRMRCRLAQDPLPGEHAGYHLALEDAPETVMQLCPLRRLSPTHRLSPESLGATYIFRTSQAGQCHAWITKVTLFKTHIAPIILVLLLLRV